MAIEIAPREALVVWLVQKSRECVDQSIAIGDVSVLDRVGQNENTTWSQHARNLARHADSNPRRQLMKHEDAAGGIHTHRADDVVRPELDSVDPDRQDVELGEVALGQFLEQAFAGLDGFGLTIVERVPLQIAPTAYNAHYIETKRDKMGHMFGAANPVEA